MGAALVLPALIAMATSPIVWTGVAIGAGVGVGAGVGCGVGKKCVGQRDAAVSSVTIFNGMAPGVGQDSAPEVAIYMASDTTSDILEGSPVYSLTHNIEASENVQRIFVTNAGSKPVCIAGVTVTQADGSSLTVSGNLGKICGADNYESRVNVLPVDAPPACTWVDRHGSNGIQLPGITIDLFERDGSGVYAGTSVEDLCKAPYMVQDAATAVNIGEYDASTSDFDSQVVKSNMTASSAVRLCEDKFSKGPNFVSLPEQLYCDMLTRDIWPVCDWAVTGVCFDVNMDELILQQGNDDAKESGGAMARDEAKAPVKVVKTFKQVDVWN